MAKTVAKCAAFWFYAQTGGIAVAQHDIDQYLSLVDQIRDRYQRLADREDISEAKVEKYREIRESLDDLADFLEQEKAKNAPIPQEIGDISDLPQELLDQLSLPRRDQLEDQILNVMRDLGGEANLDQILVGLYRKYKNIQTRRFVQNKLYRMGKKDMAYSVPGKRGVYTLEAPKDQSGYSSDLDDEIPF
jgi:hypothetical protein